ncbi:MAG: hydantoinase/oxoprolinase family protein, partial [Sphingomonadales bacterium]
LAGASVLTLAELDTVKVPSTPPDFWPSVVDALTRAGVAHDRPCTILHGTTVHLNAFLERKGARTALITTQGFRDVYEMRRGNRPQSYDLHFRYPDPLVPRKHIFEVAERTNAAGEIESRPTENEIRAIADGLRADNIESVAICFLHSYRNPENERFVADTLRRIAPDLFVTASTDVCREWREFERTSTAVINAYVSPVLKRYLSQLEEALSAWTDTRLFLLQSNGGLISAREAADKGVLTLLSGPVGGNVAGRALDDDNLICVDMGGTSFEASLVIDGGSGIRNEREVGGFPILSPMVDIHTIGAGGGSIGWNDNGNLRVGPHSAGARPGPACYGQGGDDATVTDANVAMGRLGADARLGEDLKLDGTLAGDAVARFGDQFGLSGDVAAQGITDVINEQMANAIRTITVRRGIDPRTFALVAYGGAGPMHAADIARLLNIRKVLIPRSAGAFSAWGMLQSDLIHDVAETRIMPLLKADWTAFDRHFAEQEQELADVLKSEGADPDRIAFVRSLDIRYMGQEYAIPVPLDPAQFGGQATAEGNHDAIRRTFSDLYENIYGHSNPDEGLEICTLRLRAIGHTSLDRAAFARASHREAAGGSSGVTGSVQFDGKAWTTPFIERADMAAGQTFDGPVVVRESTCTTVVPPDFSASIDDAGNLVLTTREVS